MKTSRLLLAAALACGAAACRGRREARVEEAPPANRAVVSLANVAARTGPSPRDPVGATLARGALLQIRETKGDFYKVVPPSGGEVWVRAGTFERLPDKTAREAREAAVTAFPEQPGRAIEPCPILLAPDYGAARWGSLEAGEAVAVLLAEHDFFGVRLSGRTLAFVPARSVQLLPSAPPPPAETAGRPEAMPTVSPLAPEAPSPASSRSGGPSGLLPPGPPAAGPAPPPASDLAKEPLEAVPFGGQPPVLLSKAEARYPDAARRMGLQGEVVLRVVVEATGRVGKIEVVSGAPAGMTAAAVEAVQRWVYEPARVNGRTVAMIKTIRVRFSLGS